MPTITQPLVIDTDFYIAKLFGLKNDNSSDNALAMKAAMDYCEANNRTLYLDSGTYIINSTNWNGCYTTSGGKYYSNLRIVGTGNTIVKFVTGTNPVNDISADLTGLKQSFVGIAANSSFKISGVKFYGWNRTIITQPTAAPTAVTGAGFDIEITRCEFERCVMAFTTEYYHNLRNDNTVVSGKKALYVDKLDRLIFNNNRCIDMWQMGVYVYVYRMGYAEAMFNEIVGINRGVSSGALGSIPATIVDGDRNIGINIGSGGCLGDYVPTPTGITDPQDRASVKRICYNTIKNVVKNNAGGGDTNGVTAFGGHAYLNYNYIENVTCVASPLNSEGMYTKVWQGEIVGNILKNAGQQGCITLKGMETPQSTSATQTWVGAANPYGGSTTRHYDIWHDSSRVMDNHVESDDFHTHARLGLRMTCGLLTTGGSTSRAGNYTIKNNTFKGVFSGVLFADVYHNCVVTGNRFLEMQSANATQLGLLDELSFVIRSDAGSTGWLTATAYAVGDRAYTGGIYYRCVVAHTSGTFATDLSTGKWVLLTGDSGNVAIACAPGNNVEISHNIMQDTGRAATAWTTAAYVVGDVVYNSAINYSPTYYCVSNHTGSASTDLNNPALWTRLGVPQTAIVRVLSSQNVFSLAIHDNVVQRNVHTINVLTFGISILSSSGTITGFNMERNKFNGVAFAVFGVSGAVMSDSNGRYDYNDHINKVGTASGYYLPNSYTAGKGFTKNGNRQLGTPLTAVGLPATFNTTSGSGTITFETLP